LKRGQGSALPVEERYFQASCSGASAHRAV
jgi:hypothetical protein